MIDLHIHTNNSDGSDSVIDVLKKAQKHELSYMSITDHESVNGHYELRNIDVLSYYGSGYKMSVTLKNNNGCTWNIKSYSEVRVYFTDDSYEDVYLGTNINLKADETYTLMIVI